MTPSLLELTVDAGHIVPSLGPGRLRFAVQVPHGVAQVTVTAVADTPEATLALDGAPLPQHTPSAPIPVGVGRNAIAIEVTAGGDTTTYTLKVLRDAPAPNWECVVEEGPFHIRDSAGQLVFNDRMWLLGGYLPQLTDDVWSSADGVDWRQDGNVGAQGGVNIPLNFVHDGRMWVTSNEGELFASTDGQNWELVTATLPWGKRYAAGCATFGGRMWVLGGRADAELYNDVWSSTDGVEWEQVCAHAAWSPRQIFDSVVVKDGKLWVIGGGITNYEPFRAYQDAWSSSDGVHWEQVTGGAPWPARIWTSCVVYRNRFFVLGGFRAQPNWENLGDVWYSADGRDWRQLRTEAQWSDRHEVSPYVFDDKLWVVAGNAWPLVNDVWQLAITNLAFLSQPVVEDYVGALYTYRAHADFNESCAPVRYRLTTAPEWLSVDTGSGVVSGVAPAAGAYPVTVEAYDDAGASARQSYTLHVQAL